MTRRRAIRTIIDATAFIVYTSGTTGRAKGVMLTQHGMLWVNAACWVPIAGLSGEDHVLCPLPLFHSYALNLSVLAILATGAQRIHHGAVLDHRGGLLLGRGGFTSCPACRRCSTTCCSFRAAGNRRLAGSAPLRVGRRHHAGTLNREFEDGSACRCSTATASPRPPPWSR